MRERANERQTHVPGIVELCDGSVRLANPPDVRRVAARAVFAEAKRQGFPAGLDRAAWASLVLTAPLVEVVEAALVLEGAG